MYVPSILFARRWALGRGLVIFPFIFGTTTHIILYTFRDYLTIYFNTVDPIPSRVPLMRHPKLTPRVRRTHTLIHLHSY